MTSKRVNYTIKTFITLGLIGVGVRLDMAHLPLCLRFHCEKLVCVYIYIYIYTHTYIYTIEIVVNLERECLYAQY